MIFFKTHVQAYKDNQKRLKKNRYSYVRFFALLPRRLDDGRVAWLQYIHRLPIIEEHSSGELFHKYTDIDSYWYSYVEFVPMYIGGSGE